MSLLYHEYELSPKIRKILIRKYCLADDGSRLVIWGTAEIAMTIVAASIPIIWIFVRRANIKVPYSNDGIEVCEAQQTESGVLVALVVLCLARFAVFVF